MQTIVSQTSPPKKSVLYDPEGSRRLLSGHARPHRRLPVLHGGLERCRESSSREDRFRLRVPEQHRRFRHQPDVDHLQRCRLDLWRCLHRRSAEHLAGLRHRHRARDVPRIHGRHRAAVKELDGRQGRDGLCRNAAQHPAAAAIAVLVHRGARAVAAAARFRSASAQASSSIRAACSCRVRSMRAMPG